MLFSLRMAVLLHKWEFKNIEVEFLKVSEKLTPVLLLVVQEKKNPAGAQSLNRDPEILVLSDTEFINKNTD